MIETLAPPCNKCGATESRLVPFCDSGIIFCDSSGQPCERQPGLAGELCPRLRETQQRRALQDRLDWIENLWPVPPRYAFADLSVAAIDNPHQSIVAAYEEATGFISHTASRNDPLGVSLIISGENGTGKTHLAAAIVIAARKAGLTAIFSEETYFLNKVRQGMENRNGSESRFDETSEEIIHAAESCDLLVLDDVGKARQTPWASEALWCVFNERYVHERASIITTNQTARDLANNRQWLAIVSRLQETGKPIHIAGKNLRR